MRIRLAAFALLIGIAYACSDPTASNHDIPPGQFTAVVTGDDHACALDSLGAAWCWGNNYSGQAGLTPDACIALCSTQPHRVETTLRFTALSAGRAHTCGLTPDGTAYCWGDNLYAQLGSGLNPSCRADIGCSATPLPVIGGFKYKSIVAGTYGTCAITTADVGKCWGRQSFSASPTLTSPTTITMSGTGDSTWKFLGHTSLSDNGCGITPIGTGACWGYNEHGQVGNGNLSSQRMAPGALSIPDPMQYVGTGSLYACALSTAGDVWCWGESRQGSLGVGADAVSTTCLFTTTGTCFPNPLRVVGARKYSALSVGTYHTCAIEAGTNEAWCWGSNAFNGIGAPTYVLNGQTAPSPLPATPGLQYTSIAVGYYFTCALAQDRNVYCWGSNAYGQLGLRGYAQGGIASSAAPIRIVAQ